MADESVESGKAMAPPVAVRGRQAGQPQPVPGLWKRIQQHKVVHWTLAYAAAAYTLLHVVEMISGALEWPHSIVRIAALLLLLVVPVATTLAWFHGHRAQQKISAGELAILTVLLLIAGTVLWMAGRAGRERVAAHQAAPLAATDAIAPPAAVAAPERSIAVLPFVDMSEKQDQEYFSDGLSEELIDHLTRAAGLKVIARTSSFKFKGRSEDVRTIAAMLGVAHVLEGSVRKSGKTLRVTAQLIKASDGIHVWSQTYDRTLDDVFKVQSEIAGKVAQALKVSLSADAAHAESATASTDAYNLVLKGRFFYARGTTGDVRKAIELYQQAIRLDSTYAQAWADLGRAYRNAQVRLLPRAAVYGVRPRLAGGAGRDRPDARA
jgi:TolB-like protein